MKEKRTLRSDYLGTAKRAGSDYYYSLLYGHDYKKPYVQRALR
ncbi:hypothetical protein [Larkinella arboricola]|nr:hypothetical protein [Larkinella arboricola]